MLLSLRKNGQTSLFKEVRVFKVKGAAKHLDLSSIELRTANRTIPRTSGLDWKTALG